MPNNAQNYAVAIRDQQTKASESIPCIQVQYIIIMQGIGIQNTVLTKYSFCHQN